MRQFHGMPTADFAIETGAMSSISTINHAPAAVGLPIAS
jgi:hypothetical protein